MTLTISNFRISINIGSVAGRVATMPLGVYSVSKHAIASLSHLIRQEFKPFGIECVLVEPYWARTQLGNHAEGGYAKGVEKRWSELSDEVKAEYGEECMENMKKYLGRVYSQRLHLVGQ